MSTPVATKPILIVIVLLTLMSGFIIPPAGAGMRLFQGTDRIRAALFAYLQR